MQNKHAVIIRFHYQENDPRFEWRFAYFKAMVLPRILNQSVSHFDIAIWCNEWHEERFEKLSNRIVTFRTKEDPTRRKGIYFVDFAPWNEVRGIPKYEIQSGLDSDDLITPDYIETIEKTIAEKSGGKPMHLSFQPLIFSTQKLGTQSIGITYHPKKGSAFFSIYQPAGTEPYRFAYENSHLKLWKFFPKSITLPKGKCWATAHNLNESTKAK